MSFPLHESSGDPERLSGFAFTLSHTYLPTHFPLTLHPSFMVQIKRAFLMGLRKCLAAGNEVRL